MLGNGNKGADAKYFPQQQTNPAAPAPYYQSPQAHHQQQQQPSVHYYQPNQPQQQQYQQQYQPQQQYPPHQQNGNRPPVAVPVAQAAQGRKPFTREEKKKYSVVFVFILACCAVVAYFFTKPDSDTGGTTGANGCQTLPPPDSVYRPAGDLISISFHGTGAQTYKSEIIEAVQFWNNIVSNDLQPIKFNHGYNTVDLSGGGICTDGMSVNGLDVVAEVSSFADEDGFENVLGFAAPITLDSSGKNRVRQAIMAFEVTRFGEMVASERVEVMIHELGHALGIGSLWAQLKLSNTVRNTYTGINGLNGYKLLGGTGFSVPIEPGSAEGTSGVHWSESVFENELMTGMLDPDVANPLSVMTIKSLEDLGYTVDVSKAEPYTIPGRSTASSVAKASSALRASGKPKIDLSGDGVSTEKAVGLFGRGR